MQWRNGAWLKARRARLSSSHAPLLKGVGEDLRVEPGEFVEPDQSDLGSPVLFPKIFPFPSDPNQIYKPRRLTPREGRIAIVTDAGWDAVDAAASGAH
jgi:hypothetical protein